MKAPATLPMPKVGEQRTTTSDDRLPAPGTILERLYKGRTYRVNVLDDGFEYSGEKYRSLTAVAQTITGSHWNGFLFFGLQQKGNR